MREERVDQAELLLRIDHWHGVTCDEICIESPQDADVTRSIEALDAASRTALTLDRAEASISVGGGQGRYVVFVTVGDDEEFWNLLSEADATGVVMINIGGQEGDFPARQVVDQEKATRAALCFLESGRRDPTLTWELQQ
jgi:hypothetical protein